MRDHLDVDVVLAENAKEPAGNTNHVLELFADQADNGHVGHNVDCAEVTKIVDCALEIFVLDLVLVFTTAAK